MRKYASVYFPCAQNTTAEMCLMIAEMCFAVDSVGEQHNVGRSVTVYVFTQALLATLPHLLGQVSEWLVCALKTSVPNVLGH